MGSDLMRNAVSHVRHFAMIGLVMGFVGTALAADPQSIDLVENPDEIDHAVLSGTVDL